MRFTMHVHDKLFGPSAKDKKLVKQSVIIAIVCSANENRETFLGKVIVDFRE